MPKPPKNDLINILICYNVIKKIINVIKMQIISKLSYCSSLEQTYETIKAQIEREEQFEQLQIHLNEWLSNPLAVGDKHEAARLIVDAFQKNSPFLTLCSLKLTLLPEKALALLPNLQELNCSDNHLPSLDLSNLPNLQRLYCSCNNQLQSIKLFNLPNLEMIDCSCNNQLQSLKLSNLPNLQKHRCSHTQLQSIDLFHFHNLQELDCSFNTQLQSIDLFHLPNLQELDCSICPELNQLPNALYASLNLEKITCDSPLQEKADSLLNPEARANWIAQDALVGIEL